MDKTFFFKLLIASIAVGAVVILIKYRSFNLSKVIQDNLESNASYYPNITSESVYGRP